MASLAIPHRPFGSELITGMQLPDGFFESSLGPQRINAHFQNTSGAGLPNVQFYIESVSHPGILVTPQTHSVAALPAGATRLASWTADFAAVPPGIHRISFIAEVAGARTRMIKKIFVTRVGYDPLTGTYTVTAPEGELRATLVNLVGPKRPVCCGKPRDPKSPALERHSIFEYLRSEAGRHDRDFQLCLEGYLLGRFDLRLAHTPPFTGQFSDLPYQDPFWKALLCILVLLLLIASAIAEAVDGSGSVSTTGGPGGAGSPTGDCCGLQPSGGGTSYVAAGLVAAAAAVATVAALFDAKDPFRKGQEATDPAGVTTLAESLETALLYQDPIQCGQPFKVGAKWRYTRHTTAGDQVFEADETNANIHVLSRYEIDAPDVVRRARREQFLIRARFFDADGTLMTGSALFVQCFLCGPQGQWRVFPMLDDGVRPDEKPDDGTYTGLYNFFQKEEATGYWKYFVIAQDVNTATPDLDPVTAAAIIGGMVRTGQLTIDYSGGTCAFVEDGQVNVI
jgi:hypothetical protein